METVTEPTQKPSVSHTNTHTEWLKASTMSKPIRYGSFPQQKIFRHAKTQKNTNFSLRYKNIQSNYQQLKQTLCSVRALKINFILKS